MFYVMQFWLQHFSLCLNYSNPAAFTFLSLSSSAPCRAFCSRAVFFVQHLQTCLHPFTRPTANTSPETFVTMWTSRTNGFDPQGRVSVLFPAVIQNRTRSIMFGFILVFFILPTVPLHGLLKLSRVSCV